MLHERSYQARMSEPAARPFTKGTEREHEGAPSKLRLGGIVSASGLQRLDL